MPRNSGVSFPDASYSYRRSQGQSGCGCGAGAAEGCTGGCGQDPDIPVYDCTCQEEVPYRLCCDENGRCCRYPANWRNSFWPEFSHPGGSAARTFTISAAEKRPRYGFAAAPGS